MEECVTYSSGRWEVQELDADLLARVSKLHHNGEQIKPAPVDRGHQDDPTLSQEATPTMMAQIMNNGTNDLSEAIQLK